MTHNTLFYFVLLIEVNARNNMDDLVNITYHSLNTSNINFKFLSVWLEIMPEVNLDVSSIQFEEGLHFQVDEHEILLRGESYSNSSSTSSIDDDIVDDFFLSYYPDPLDEFYSDYSFDEVGLSEEEAYHECSMARIGGKNKNRKCCQR